MMQIRMGRFEASSVKRASRPHHMLTTVYSYSSHGGSQFICTEPVQVQYLLPVQCPSVSDPGPNLLAYVDRQHHHRWSRFTSKVEGIAGSRPYTIPVVEHNVHVCCSAGLNIQALQCGLRLRRKDADSACREFR
jgi:hypothetical protein